MGYPITSALARIAFCALIFCALTPSQTTREKRVAAVQPGLAAGFNQAGTVGVAVLVGVGKYPSYSGLGELHYPTDDVDTLAATLRSQRYDVLSLTNSEATKTAVTNAIRQAGKAFSGENFSIIFFFSGHGFAVAGENYLATFDAGRADLASSGLKVKDVETELIRTKAARRVLWIDACRDETAKGAGESRSFANLQAAAGTRMLLSTKAGEVSYEDEELKRGVFSYYLAKGLGGEAAGPDGLITFQDLASYVTLRVRSRSLQMGHAQVPYEAGEASGDFLLARTRAAIPDRGPQPGQVKVNAKDGQRYVWIPPGSFLMGCSPGDAECREDENPAHNVSITKGFWLGQMAVTQAAYIRVIGTNPSHFKGDNLPVEQVTWDEAKHYCEAVGGRLPTEAEWEYAARAGTVAARYGDLDAIAWYDGNSGNTTHPGGQKPPNAWNLYDMLGNVWQWTADWYGEKYYSQQESTDPQGPPVGGGRVLRGGSWVAYSQSARASNPWLGRAGVSAQLFRLPMCRGMTV